MKTYTGVLLLMLLLALGGCANNSEARAGYNETLSQQRSALVRLSSEPDYANRAQMEISEIDSLLRQVEFGLAQDSPGERVDLILQTTQARISSVQALYAQWIEEERLERARVTYEDTTREIKRIRKENTAVFEGGDQ